MAELVGSEHVTVVEGRQVVDVDLSCLEKEREEEQEVLISIRLSKSLRF